MIRITALLGVVFLAACKPQVPQEPHSTPPPAPTPIVITAPDPIQSDIIAEPSPAPTIPQPTPYPSPTPSGKYAFQSKLWYSAKIRPEWVGRLDKVISRTILNRQRYEAIEAMRPNGVPWFVVAGLHERESTQSFDRHLHEGSPLTGRTRFVPKGRIPDVPPPYTWEQSAEDALYVLKRLDKVSWTDLNEALQAIEAYNGLGYQKYHRDISSPYVWSGTSHHSGRGKYFGDGQFSYNAVEKQIGVAALILLMNERGVVSYFPQNQNSLNFNQ